MVGGVLALGWEGRGVGPFHFLSRVGCSLQDGMAGFVSKR